jgi:hypothetical protein
MMKRRKELTMEYDKSRIEAVVKDVITKLQGPFRHPKDQVEVIQIATAEGGYLWTIETPQPDGKWAQEKGARTTVGIEDSSAEALATATTVCGMCEAKHT